VKVKHLTRPLEIKAVSEDGSFEGYGSVFNVEDSYKDLVMPGAFARSIGEYKQKGSMPALLWQHDHKEPIGVWSEMFEDDYGLKLKGTIALNTTKGRDVYELLKMGAVKGLSIGYSIAEGGEEYDEKAGVWRLSDVNLWETSIVTFPANAEAQVTTVKEALASPREFERLLRDVVGLSQSQAKRLMARGYGAIKLNDEVGDSLDVEAIIKRAATIREVKS